MLYQKYAIALILFLALSLSVSGYIILKHRQQIWLEHDFAEMTQQKIIAIRHNLQQHFSILKAYAALFSANPDVDYNTFLHYSDIINHNQQNNLLALHWIPRVEQNQRDYYEKILANISPQQKILQKNQQGELIAADSQAEYYPVLFSLIKQQHHIVLPTGLDLRSNPVLWQNLKYARETGKIYASEPILLASQQTILLIQPVYQHHAQTPQQRREYLQGFIVAVFDVQKLLNNVLRLMGEQHTLIRLKIPVQDKAIYVVPEQAITDDLMQMNRILIVAGRVWEMQVFMNISHIHVPSTWLEATLFLAASFLTLLITWLFFQYFRHLDLVKKTQQQLTAHNSELAAKLNQGTVALQKSHERLKIILNSLEAMVCVVDMDSYEVLFANKSLKQILDIKGKVEGNICWQSFYKNQDKPCQYCNHTKLIDENGQPTGLVTWEYYNSDNKRWYLMQDRAIPWSDGRIVRLEIASDITERKQMEVVLRESEQYRRTLIEASTIGLMLINMDDNGTFSEVNSAFANSLGYEVDELINSGITFWDLTPEEFHPITHKQQIILKQTGRFGPYEKAYLHKDGHPVPIRLSGLLIKHKGESFIWSNVEDITYQKRTQEAEAAKVIAEQANRAKSMCLTNMSHELRTPLNAILGYTQILLQSNNLNPEQYEGLNIIQHSSEYLLNLIDDILDISKVEAGKLELNVTDFHFENFIKNVVDLFRVRALQKSIEFIYQPLEQPPYVVYSDEKRLRQILINLLSNAVKFTPEYGCVTFAVVRVSENKIQFKIRDTGIGIAQEEIEKIFMPFQQAGDNAARAEGAGLGLAITQNLVKLLNADLQVKSVLGQGTEFDVTITLPETHNTRGISQDNQVVGYQGSLKTLLIADKIWEYRISLKNFLSPLNFNLLEANSISSLLEKLQQKPDAVLIDWHLAQQLDSLAQPSIPLIITGEQNINDISINYQALLTKPYDKTALLESLKQALDLTWLIQKTEITQDIDINLDMISHHYPLSPRQIHQLYDLSMMGDIKGILNFAQLIQSDKQLVPLAQHIHQLAKQLQLEHIYQIATHYQDTLQ